MSYGERLRRARERAGMTQAGVAREVGVAPNTVCGWEAGTHHPIPQHGLRVRRLLGVEPAHTWANSEAPTDDPFGRPLRMVRKERGLTQKKLSELVGVSHNTVSQWELGVNRPDLMTKAHLSVVLDHPLGLTRSEAVRAARDAILAVHRETSHRYDGPTPDAILTAHAGGWDLWGETGWADLCREAMEQAREVDPDVSKVPSYDREAA